MSPTHLPCGDYHQNYKQDHGWWQTRLIQIKMIILLIILLLILPYMLDSFWISIVNQIGYTVLGVLGVQLLIGYCGLLTLGHAAFIAVGAYTSALLVTEFPWPQFMIDYGLAYPISIIIAGIIAGLWSVLFGLPSARVKGFYLILTTMAAQFVTVGYILQHVTKLTESQASEITMSDSLQLGPWVINLTEDSIKIYYFMVVLVILCCIIVINLTRSRVGRAWIAIRDNDISAEVMGINVIKYKLLAFFVAGFIAGIAGAFYITICPTITHEPFGWDLSLWLVGAILIGGVASIHGAFFGSFFMVLLIELLKLLKDSITETPFLKDAEIAFLKDIVFGFFICVFIIYEPKGLAYRWQQIKNYFNLWPFSY